MPKKQYSEWWVGAATAKLREPKYVWTRGTESRYAP